jgi:hypothetical protein
MPELNQWESHYYTMYSDLTGSRNWTAAGPTEIPYALKLMWLDENFIFDPHDRDDYMTMIKVLDAEYLEHTFKKAG